MPTTTKFVSSMAALFLLAGACGGGSIDSIDIPTAGAGGAGAGTGGSSATGGTAGGGATAGTGGNVAGTGGNTAGTGGSTGGVSATGGVGGTGGSVMAGSSGGPPATGGAGGAAGGSGVGGAGGAQTGGTAGTGGDPAGGSAGTDVPMGGTAGTGGDPAGGSAGTGMAGGGSGGQGPYAARTGSFKMLAYSKTGGFRHTDAINAGKPMLTAMGTKQGFEVTFSEDPGAFTTANLAQYEVVFGLDPTGNNLSSAQKAAFEEWMGTKNGAFAGVHSSTDHENGWAFYSEVTGQYYDLHDACCSQQNIQWDPGATDFIAVKGLPSPWQRSEEWYKFNSNASWSAKPGFKILSRVTTSGGGTRPVSFVREWGNFRSFYTSLGHEGPTYSDANFVKHVAAGIMWSVRREALLKP